MYLIRSLLQSLAHQTWRRKGLRSSSDLLQDSPKKKDQQSSKLTASADFEFSKAEAGYLVTKLTMISAMTALLVE